MFKSHPHIQSFINHTKKFSSLYYRILFNKLPDSQLEDITNKCSRPYNLARYILIIWTGFFAIGLAAFIFGFENKTGQFGDFFGGINALFSGLALAGVVISLFYQREDLRLQREELTETRKELEGQKEALEKQNIIWEKQNFDSLFFSFLNTHNNIKNSLEHITRDKEPVTYRGNYVFNIVVEDFKGIANNYNDYSELGDVYLTLLLTIYPFEAYARSLVTLIEVVDEHASNCINKDDYYKLISNSISSTECLVLYFYGSLQGYGVLKKFIEKHSILTPLTLSTSIPFTELPPFFCYTKRAFAS